MDPIQTFKTTEQLRQQVQKTREHKTTRFEITMILEVVDVGDVPADASTLADSVKTAIEGISSGDVVKVNWYSVGTHTSRKS